MRMEALGLQCETEPAAASAKEIRSIGNADLQRIRNMTASTHTLGKGFLNLLKEWQKDYISCIYIYVRMSVCSSKKQSAASALKYLLRITETALFSYRRPELHQLTPGAALMPWGCWVPG